MCIYIDNRAFTLTIHPVFAALSAFLGLYVKPLWFPDYQETFALAGQVFRHGTASSGALADLPVKRRCGATLCRWELMT